MADVSIGSFSIEQTRIIWDVVQKSLAAAGIQNTRKIKLPDEPGAHRVRFKNNSGEEIPAFACMEIEGTEDEVDLTFLLVKKPETICGEYVFNSQFAVPADGFGWAYAFGQVRMRGTEGTFSACTRHKPTAGSWDVSEGPGPFIVYGTDITMEGALRGRIVGDKCKAKWIKFTYATGMAVTVDQFYDGADPTDCGEITVVYPLREPCDDDVVLAFYDPNEDQYVAIATESAMLGTPITKTLPTAIAAASCGLTVTKEPYLMFPSLCEPETPNEESISLGTTVPVVVSMSAGDCGEISYAYQNIKAFACDSEGEPTSPSFSDFAIDFGAVKFLTAAAFGGNPNCGSATWEYNTDTAAWTLISGCPGGCSGGEQPSTPPSTFNAQYEWDGSDWNILFPCDPGGTSSPPGAPGGFIGETLEVPCIHTVEVACTQSAGAGCGLNLTYKTLAEICSEESEPGEVVHVPLELTPINVVQEVYEGSGAIIIERAIAYVCSWEVAAEDQITLTECPTSGSSGP